MMGAPGPVQVIPIAGVPEIAPKDDLARLLLEALSRTGLELRSSDVLVITQKVVSKMEGRIRRVPEGDPEARRAVAEQEAARIVRRRNGLLIAETTHGFICANAGVDASNLEPGLVTLLPLDPDRSARSLRSRLRFLTGKDPAVVISDTFGRPWRVGQTNVAIGVAGMDPLIDYRGSKDTFGTVLSATAIAVADEIASAAELVMGKAEGVPAALVRGARFRRGRKGARSLVRPASDDMFR